MKHIARTRYYPVCIKHIKVTVGSHFTGCASLPNIIAISKYRPITVGVFSEKARHAVYRIQPVFIQHFITI